MGVAALKAGDLGAAAGHFAAALSYNPEDSAAHWHTGGIAWRTGQFLEAAAHFDRARQLDPRNPGYALDAAFAHWRSGAVASALKCCQDALALAPAIDAGHQLLAAITFPGPAYLDLLPRIHARLRPGTYVEIGVASGDSIALLPPTVRAIGIDPDPAVTRPLSACTTIFAETSDDYFATHDVLADLGGRHIDVAFIDGMHLFEYALRDFTNIEKYCTRQSTILIHDCLPLTRLTADRNRQTSFWSGDIWRLVLILRKYRQDLQVNVVATGPTGLGVVRCLDPQSRVLMNNFDDIVAEMLAVDYSVLERNKGGMLGLYPNEWERISTILGPETGS